MSHTARGKSSSGTHLSLISISSAYSMSMTVFLTMIQRHVWEACDIRQGQREWERGLRVQYDIVVRKLHLFNSCRQNLKYAWQCTSINHPTHRACNQADTPTRRHWLTGDGVCPASVSIECERSCDSDAGISATTSVRASGCVLGRGRRGDPLSLALLGTSSENVNR